MSAEEQAGQAVAAVICTGCWGLIAVPIALAAHVRMRAVEREERKRALPANESSLLWYAVASFAWPMALGAAIVGLAKRDWARVGRNATLILLGHLTLAVLAALLTVPQTDSSPEDVLPIVWFACAIVGGGTLGSCAFSWRWAGLRAERIAREPSEEPPMGPVRFAIYAASALAWPAGIIAAVVLSKPHDVHVGKVAFRISMAQLALIALGVCVGLPLLIGWLDQLPHSSAY